MGDARWKRGFKTYLIGVKRLYMFQTRLEDASPTMMRLGYSNKRIRTLSGEIQWRMRRVLATLESDLRESILFSGMVSGRKRITSMVARPPSAACSQKMTRQDLNVTIMPPIKGPKAGPMRVPDKNQPRAVARAVGV